MHIVSEGGGGRGLGKNELFLWKVQKKSNKELPQVVGGRTREKRPNVWTHWIKKAEGKNRPLKGNKNMGFLSTQIISFKILGLIMHLYPKKNSIITFSKFNLYIHLNFLNVVVTIPTYFLLFLS